MLRFKQERRQKIFPEYQSDIQNLDVANATVANKQFIRMADSRQSARLTVNTLSHLRQDIPHPLPCTPTSC